MVHGSDQEHFVGVFSGRIALGGAMLMDYEAGPAFRHLVGALKMPGRIPSARRA